MKSSQSIKGLALAVLLGGSLLAGGAQAHSDIDYSVPAKLLLLSAFLEPWYDHGYGRQYLKPRRIHSHHRHGHHKHHLHHGRHGHHGRIKKRSHSHSHGHYRNDRGGKRRHRD